jgi:hypothetical protein
LRVDWNPTYLSELDGPPDYGRLTFFEYYNPHTDKHITFNPNGHVTPPLYSSMGIDFDTVARPTDFNAPFFINQKKIRRYARIKDLEWESDESDQNTYPFSK